VDLNKTGMFRDASLANLSWLTDAVTFDSDQMKDPTDKMISELGVEWGRAPGDIGEIENLNVVERNIPKDIPNDNGMVVRFARERMLQGKMGAELGRMIREKFPRETIVASLPELKKALELEGILGTVVVDAQGFDSCEEAMKFASKSPFRKHQKYIINCNCGSTHDISDGGGTDLFASLEGEASENAIDGFLSDGSVHKEERTAHCVKTMKPILAGMDDLPSQMVDSTLVELMNSSGITEEEAETIKKKKGKASKKIAFAFKLAASKVRMAKRMRYGDPVDNSEHIMNKAAMSVDMPVIAKIEEIDVCVADERLDREVDLTPEAGASINITGVDSFMHEDLEEMPEINVPEDLSIDGRAAGSDFLLNPERIADLEIENDSTARFGGESEIELDEEISSDELDVDPGADLFVDL